MQTIDNTEDYKFLSNNKEIPLKATLSFKSDSLDWNENLITVYATDASGNRDTLRLSVLCSLNGHIDILRNYPNPTTNTTTFTFSIEAPEQGNVAIIDIYDVYGRKVKTLEQAAQIGWNHIYWDCLDEQGNPISTGAYYYFLQFRGYTYFEPTSSNMIIVR